MLENKVYEAMEVDSKEGEILIKQEEEMVTDNKVYKVRLLLIKLLQKNNKPKLTLITNKFFPNF